MRRQSTGSGIVLSCHHEGDRAGDKNEGSDCSDGSVREFVFFPTCSTRNLHFLGVVQRQADV